jgi:hypothetical protein
MGLTEAIKVAAIPNEPAILVEIRKFFSLYGPTFVELADGERSDLNTLLEFYGAPLRFIGSNFHMVMKDDAAITGEDGMGGEIGRLRHAHLPGRRWIGVTSKFSTHRPHLSMRCGFGGIPRAQ